ncbi:unnamed protein product [Blepharisma stoltei]|uniref:RRM domain-containing protein n=1 Tax=Blepharisma stoltei TaxID=1481888 RepID=A0AAU9I9N5_9CILI|nr:unnamed protein product [Blepharisma stoltei]
MIKSTLKRLLSSQFGRQIMVIGLPEPTLIHELTPYLPKAQRIAIHNKFCFISFDSQIDAAYAVQVLNGHVVKGQRIRARMTTPTFDKKP